MLNYWLLLLSEGGTYNISQFHVAERMRFGRRTRRGRCGSLNCFLAEAGKRAEKLNQMPLSFAHSGFFFQIQNCFGGSGKR